MGVDAEMFVRTKHKVTDTDLRKWHYSLGCAFHEHLWAFGTHANKVPDKLYLFRVDRWAQDGPTLYPEKGETFLRLHPRTRYYGPGYERGDFPTIKALAEFLELLIPEAEVWYGGDLSGICAERFGPLEREQMLHHWVENQHRPYLTYGRDTMNSTNPVCPYCHEVCPQYGWGGSYAASYTCIGCGWERTTRDGKVYEGWKLSIDEFGREKVTKCSQEPHYCGTPSMVKAKPS